LIEDAFINYLTLNNLEYTFNPGKYKLKFFDLANKEEIEKD
jgi:hypothetical protein